MSKEYTSKQYVRVLQLYVSGHDDDAISERTGLELRIVRSILLHVRHIKPVKTVIVTEDQCHT